MRLYWVAAIAVSISGALSGDQEGRMRILFGGPPVAAEGSGDAGAGKPIRQPGRWTSAVLAALAGLMILTVIILISAVHSHFFPIVDSDPSYEMANRVIPWAGMLFVFVLGILAHELMHAMLYPDGGRSNSTLLILNWKRLQFAAYYEGRIPRGRWIVMRLFPMLALTGVALSALFIFYYAMTFAIESFYGY
jgi:hypothetical protein